MHILHVNTEKSWRGGERQVLITAVEQRRLGLDSRIACRRGSPLEAAARVEGIRTLALPGSGPGTLLGLARAAWSCNVVQCHTGRAHSLAALLTVLRSKPLVLSRRTDVSPPLSGFNRWKYGRVDRVVCVCQWVARVMLNWGMPTAKVSVIYEAVPGDAYLPREECLRQLREKAGVGPDQRIVGNIAALVPDKDQATLLRAARVVTSRRPDVAFVIIGDGELREPLHKLRSELGLENSVHFAGFIPQAQRLLPGIDVFAMSSTHEGFCTVILDAALAGVPVASTAGGGIPENVLKDQTGLLVPVGDAGELAGAILKLLSDAPLAARLAGAALKRTRTEFAPELMAKKYVEVYQSLLDRGRRGSRGSSRAA
jgi:glycosyltransferase involved in cell wall biosynthesis